MTVYPRARASQAVHTAGEESKTFPLSPLLVLAVAGFITILTETLPAGLLPQMGGDLFLSPADVGQLVTVYAIGSLVAAIPLTIATQRIGRKLLLLFAIGGFAVVNTITATTSVYWIMLTARFFAGVSAGLLWALIAGYAARMVTDDLKGRAIAVAMIGTPLALSLGIPLGTYIGTSIGWRSAFGIMTGLTILLTIWAAISLPRLPGTTDSKRATIVGTLAISGIKPVMLVTLAFVLAHNLLYTYIAPIADYAELGSRLDTVLLVFGIAAIIGIIGVGIGIDGHLRRLTLASILIFSLTTLALALAGDDPAVLYLGTFVWGLAFGGAATLFQTAAAKASGKDSDVAQSMIVTVWNGAIAGGSFLGGLLLQNLGVPSLAWTAFFLLALAFAGTIAAKSTGFAPACAKL